MAGRPPRRGLTPAPTTGGGGVLLAYRALGLGDLLTAVPALRATRARWPEHRLVLAVPGALGEAALRWELADEVADVRPFAVPRLDGPDVAVNLHGRGPQSTRALLDAAPRELVAFASAEAGWDGGPPWRADEHEVRRWCRLLAGAGASPDPLDLLLPGAVEGGRRDGVAVLHPGAASRGRRWPVARFAAVARHLAHEGLEVVVTGGPGEEELADAVVAGAGAGRVQMGPLAELEALLRRAAVVVVGDTGVGHLAVACGTPGVHLMGPVPPTAWGPLRTAHRVVLHRPAPDDAGDPHADDLDPALGRLEVADVLDAVRVVTATVTATVTASASARAHGGRA